jgi:purine-cytosine permease-like protein
MPRYLRWIAACTAGITIQFAFFVAVGAVAVGTGNKEIHGFVGGLVTFLSPVLTMVAALAINDWLSSRYPIEPARPVAEREPAERR